ncbi:Hypothetical protein RMHFA_00084 [Roseomonas mucosa]|jgi:hypothetical protein|uniref:hypothetical protein n=1 Tax=Roseomonas TaxID=125216 RepID=UPI000C18C433|nr:MULTISPECIES: hypothetical protein [Roseomonas]ATR21991.1 hypothetical protein CTJ15_17925 [Roseomonas sp. FDAARGOS_362]MDT8262240.1 hypothetical protein [Roseomonas sp. DSM 102946]UZO95522.1 Hypothetical protein RMHFA_00084 [Roseomonas mucosa]
MGFVQSPRHAFPNADFSPAPNGAAEAGISRPWGHGRIHRWLDKARQHGLSLPSNLAARALRLPWTDRLVGDAQARARAAHLPELPALSAADAALLRTLLRDGVCVTSLEELGLPGTAAMLASATSLTDRLAARRRQPEHAHRHTVTATAQDLLDFPAILEWGLGTRLLDLVENYLGLPVAYDGPDHFYSPADGREAGPRIWHRDREDRRMLKIAVYISDVGPQDGPFEIVHPDFRERLGGPRQAAILPQAELERRIGPEGMEKAIRTCTGRRGTVVIAETAENYHRGRPPVRSDRSALYYGYFSRFTPTPFFCERSPLTRAQIARIASGLPERQHDALLWRRFLPAWKRVVPTNRIRV